MTYFVPNAFSRLSVFPKIVVEQKRYLLKKPFAIELANGFLSFKIVNLLLFNNSRWISKENCEENYN